MRKRERALSTLQSAKAARKSLVEKLARKMIDGAGKTIESNSTEHWVDVGRYKLLDEILWAEDK